MVMKRGQNVKMFMSAPPAPESDEDRFWSNVCNRIASSQVIPIVSNGLIYDLVFSKALGGEEDGSAELDGPMQRMTVPNMLSMAWANEVLYPFPDSEHLARVAQYVRSKSASPVDAKEDYLNFLKNALLSYASQVGVDKDHIAEVQAGLREYSFGDLAVQELELIQFGPGCSDPLSILASMPLSVYITTSYHDLLERALLAMGKQPVTQVCPWSIPLSSLQDEHKPLDTFEPSPQKPLVYHLYGLDRYPLSMVLGEDDYLDFLVEITLDRGTSRAVIPAYVQSALVVSWLMVVGYSMTEWDFRTLFRGIITGQDKKNLAFRNTIIQLSFTDQYMLPQDANVRQYLTQAQKYLQDYFTPLSFEIRWSNPTEFLTTLLKEWRNRRQK